MEINIILWMSAYMHEPTIQVLCLNVKNCAWSSLKSSDSLHRDWTSGQKLRSYVYFYIKAEIRINIRPRIWIEFEYSKNRWREIVIFMFPPGLNGPLSSEYSNSLLIRNPILIRISITISSIASLENTTKQTPPILSYFSRTLEISKKKIWGIRAFLEILGISARKVNKLKKIRNLMSNTWFHEKRGCEICDKITYFKHFDTISAGRFERW